MAAREVRNLLLASEGEAFGERVEKAAELERRIIVRSSGLASGRAEAVQPLADADSRV